MQIYGAQFPWLILYCSSGWVFHSTFPPCPPRLRSNHAHNGGSATWHCGAGRRGQRRAMFRGCGLIITQKKSMMLNRNGQILLAELNKITAQSLHASPIFKEHGKARTSLCWGQATQGEHTETQGPSPLEQVSPLLNQTLSSKDPSGATAGCDVARLRPPNEVGNKNSPYLKGNGEKVAKHSANSSPQQNGGSDRALSKLLLLAWKQTQTPLGEKGIKSSRD